MLLADSLVAQLRTACNGRKLSVHLLAAYEPMWAQEDLQNYLESSGRCPSPLFEPILGPSWAILGGPGGHLEAKFGLGRLDLRLEESNLDANLAPIWD